MVAGHLVMAGYLVDTDPQIAYEHAKAAERRAWRMDIVREAKALTAYAAGEYAEALREVRTVRRLSGLNVLISVEADCERGLGRPEKALEVIAQADLEGQDPAELAEIAIVASSARADLGEHEVGLSLIEEALEKADTEDDYVMARLLTVKVDRLRELGREEEADALEEEIPELPEEVDVFDIEAAIDEEDEGNPTPLKRSAQALSEAYEVALLDLDGVVYMGTERIENAKEGFDEAIQAGMTPCFVTNNAARPPQAVVEKLGDMGIEAKVEQVITAAQDAAQTLSEKIDAGSKVLAIGGPGVTAALEEFGLVPVTSAQDEPAAVMQGLGFDVSWKELTEAAYAVNAGALYVATNMDPRLPTERGFGVGNGSLVQAVVNATGVKPLACGKPLAQIYSRAVAKVGGGDALGVGDQLSTDIAGALAAGIPSLHVLTGVSDARDVILAVPSMRPTYVGIDMTDLNREAPRPTPEDKGGWWNCEGARARIHTEDIEIDGLGILEDGTEISLDEYRAIIAAAWDAADKGRRINCPQLTVVREVERQVPQEELEEETPDEASSDDLREESQDDLHESPEITEESDETPQES
ncbi:MAG: HAD-IIA family hydrolase [Actinomycetaceae bacterium]|nr:HAD-IIA family hydrolase [Actinomycetaceae bacterium]